MARLPNGLLGGFIGTIGNIEGYMFRGKMVCRTKRIKTTKPPTEKQLASRQKMKLVKEFIGAFIEIVRTGFAYNVIGKDHSAYDAAIGWHIKNAITGEYPHQTINYAAVRFSLGPIDPTDLGAMTETNNDQLIFTWKPDHSFLHANDRVMLLAYAPALKEAVFTQCGARRSAGTDSLILPVSEWGKDIVVETYLSFITENGIRCMDSIYTGRFDIGTQV